MASATGKGARMSRRELFRLAVPHHEDAPRVSDTLCRGTRACGLCLQACPFQAIAESGGKPEIKLECRACGLCAAACPFSAIADASGEGLEIRLQAQVEKSNTVTLACQRCSGAGESIKLSCLGMISPLLVLRAFDLGAGSITIISGGECRCGLEPSRWQESLVFTRELLSVLGISGERILVKEAADGAAPVAPALAGTPTALEGGGRPLAALVRGLMEKAGKSRGVVSSGPVPFGKVEIDSDKCTGCGICAFNCPTGALELSGSEGYSLTFAHGECAACGRCASACPEKCLKVRSVLELEALGSRVAIFEDEMAHCRRCGKAIGPRAMVKRIKALLPAFQETVELCPSCKTGHMVNPDGLRTQALWKQ